LTTEQIYRKASDTWGTVAQLIVAVEECAELQQAIIKAIRSGVPSDNLAEELADVEIMIEQVKSIFPGMPVEEWKAKKLARLEKKLE
jgi:NTP pyrophosphatase (non-canonical NTP hydrolase)